MLEKIRDLAHQVTHSHGFEYFIVGLILFNAVLLGVETIPYVIEQFATWVDLGKQAILWVFVVEAVLKIFAVSPRADRYFRDGWNVFDFSIIVLAFIPATGSFAIIARLARLMRLLRLVSAVPELRLIVATLVRSIPSMLHIVALMSLMVYIYAIIGYQLFHEHDPEHWRNLGISLLSLFRVVTLEDWTDIMYKAMEYHPLTWMYFVSFVVFGTFVVINLFIAVVINNLDEAKQERLRAPDRPPQPMPSSVNCAPPSSPSDAWRSNCSDARRETATPDGRLPCPQRGAWYDLADCFPKSCPAAPRGSRACGQGITSSQNPCQQC